MLPLLHLLLASSAPAAAVGLDHVRTDPGAYDLVLRPASITGLVVGGAAKSVFIYKRRIDAGGATIPIKNNDPKLSVIPDDLDMLQLAATGVNAFAIKALRPGNTTLQFTYATDVEDEPLVAWLPVQTVVQTVKLQASVIEINLLVDLSFDLRCIPLIATLSDGSTHEVSAHALYILRSGEGFGLLQNSVLTGLVEGRGMVQAALGEKSTFIRFNITGHPP